MSYYGVFWHSSRWICPYRRTLFTIYRVSIIMRHTVNLLLVDWITFQTCATLCFKYWSLMYKKFSIVYNFEYTATFKNNWVFYKIFPLKILILDKPCIYNPTFMMLCPDSVSKHSICWLFVSIRIFRSVYTSSGLAW